MTKTKGLSLIIILLLVSNLVAWFMLFNKKQAKPERKAQAREFLKKDVGFTDAQLKSFDSIVESFREKARAEMTNVRKKKAAIMKAVAADNFSDNAIAKGSKDIAEAGQHLDYLMLEQAAGIRAICTPEQLPRFDEGWMKMYRKRSPSKKK